MPAPVTSVPEQLPGVPLSPVSASVQRRPPGTPLQTFLLRPFLLPFVLLLGVGLAVLVGVWLNAKSRTQVTDAQARLTLLELLSGDISTMENGQRGYIITGDQDFLTPYLEAQGAFQAHVYALQDMSVTPEQRSSLEQLQKAVERWDQQAAQPEITARQTSLQEAVRQVALGTGKRLMEQARRELDSMQLAENARLSDSGAASAATLNTVRWIAVAGLLLGMLLVFLTIWRVSRTLSRTVSQVTESAREIAAGQYHLRLPDSPVLELAQLGEQFDRMAGAVQEREHALQSSNEQLARSNRELEQFAYIASHDLQEPLRTIGSYTELLAQRYSGQLDARADKYIAFTTQATERLKRLIQDLLAFSRVRQGGRRFGTVDTQQVVQEVLSDLKAQVEAVSGQIELGTLPTVHGNPELLRHAFQNLLGNALKFHAPGRPPLVKVAASREAGRWMFHVQDNGIGIEEQYHARIFGVFQRLHGLEDYAGSGIGLAVTRSAIEQHGGELWVDSTPGQGSTFHFSLPDPTQGLDQANAAPPNSPQEKHQ